MAAIVAGWSFFGFLYYKIMFDWVFDVNSSVLGAALLGVSFGIYVFVFSGVCAARLMPLLRSEREGIGHAGERFGVTFLSFLLSLPAIAVVQRLLIFGFSKSLNREIEQNWHRGITRDAYTDFAIVILVPVFFYYMTVVFGDPRVFRKRT